MVKKIAYYNEIDPYAVEWLRTLIKEGHIAPGIVDDRSIEDVTPNDLEGFNQCHFFAGIGIWSLSLKQAGWPDEQPVWTGSCPCQPFSQAGKKVGFADQRHLWPALHWLIKQCQPDVIFGEQVPSKDGLSWFDVVQSDMEGEDYSCGGAVLCAAGAGLPHIRQRLFWVANANSRRIPGFQPTTNLSQVGQRWSCSKMDLQQILDSPFLQGDSWPQPLLRSMDDGYTTRVGRLRAYGNAISPYVAKEFIESYLSTRTLI